MKRNRRGTGCVFRRPGSRFLWLKFNIDGKTFRESAETDKKIEAQAKLDQRLEQARHRTYNPEAKRVRVSDLMPPVWQNYRDQNQKTLDDAEARWKLHLEPAFGNYLAASVGSDLVNRYKQQRLAEGAKSASINRELALLKRAYNLAVSADPPKVNRVPRFEMLDESNVRTGFVRDDQYQRLADACGTVGLWMRALFECGFTYGWRIGELLNLRVRQVDLTNGTIHLDPLTTKNREGRTAVMTETIRPLLTACLIGKQPNDFVFSREGGKPVRDFRGTWAKVTTQAEVPGLLFHDLRRSGVRNMVRSGVPEHTAMKISGHRTRSVFDRYDVVSEDDLRVAARLLDTYRQRNMSEVKYTDKSQLHQDKGNAPQLTN